jgi:penicillin-binding protein 1A
VKFVAVLSALCVTAAACGSARDAPPIALPENAQPSAIYDANGTLITTLGEENRRNVALEQIPRSLQDAVVAIEDARFWTHNGVDPRAVARAAGANAQAGGVAEGGSTITQQYVKNALLTPEQTLGRKVEEATTALALERNYSKQLILELYLNTIYLGNGAYGVSAAAQEYFGVPVEDLTLEQSAMIAGIIQAPSRHDPRTDPVAAIQRRNLVLQRMREQQLITGQQEERASATPLTLAPATPAATEQRYAAPHFVDEVKSWLLHTSDALGSTTAERRDALLRGGLRIETTIDLNLQAQAEQAIRDVLPGQGADPRTPDAALVSVDPRSGYVRAMVGGYDYFGTHSYRQTNLAAGAGRQTGSAFKPIVMATALENGVSPSKLFNAPSATVLQIPGGIWRVKGGGIGAGTMAECTVVSSNTCYANIMMDPDVGPERSVEMAQKLGIVSTKVQPTPAIVLGANNATVADMASVYGTFANDGVRVPPVLVTKITGPDGAVVYQHAHTQTRAMSSENVRQIAPALEGVIQRGTGTSAAIDRPAGGKTGSAQNNTDAWFCGYTQQLSTAVWVGFAEPRANSRGERQLVSMTPPNTRITVYGGTYPAQIWARFMKGALADVEPTPLMDPLITPTTTTTLPASNSGFVAPVAATEQVAVPDLSGLDAATAKARVERAGLRAQQVVTTSSSAQPGSVANQSPTPGSKVPRGATVWIEVTALPTTTTTSTSTTTTTTVPGRRGTPTTVAD